MSYALVTCRWVLMVIMRFAVDPLLVALPFATTRFAALLLMPPNVLSSRSTAILPVLTAPLNSLLVSTSGATRLRYALTCISLILTRVSNMWLILRSLKPFWMSTSTTPLVVVPSSRLRRLTRPMLLPTVTSARHVTSPLSRSPWIPWAVCTRSPLPLSRRCSRRAEQHPPPHSWLAAVPREPLEVHQQPVSRCSFAVCPPRLRTPPQPAHNSRKKKALADTGVSFLSSDFLKPYTLIHRCWPAQVWASPC